jgi:hypothetical protein
VDVVELRENAYINFHSRLIIGALIVWMVRGTKCGDERKGKKGQQGNMCPHLLAELYGLFLVL